MADASFYCYQSSLGPLTIAADGNAVTNVVFGKIVFPGMEKPCALTNAASTQLLQYLARKRLSFDFPVRAAGSPFQMRVWNEVSRIPYGQVRSYTDIARAIGNPKATRAVGMAVKRNPLLMVVPCHRVVGAHGAIGSYAGGVRRKEKLLTLEGAILG